MLMPVSFRVPAFSAANASVKSQTNPAKPVTSPLLFAGNGWRKAGMRDSYSGREDMSRGDWDAFIEACGTIAQALRGASNPKAITIGSRTFSLTRKETMGGTMSGSGVRDFAFTLKSTDGQVSITSDFIDHTPQNYDRTPTIHFVNSDKRVDYYVGGYQTNAVAQLREAMHSVFKVDSII